VYAVIIGVLEVITQGVATALSPSSVTTYNSYSGGVEYSTSSSFGVGSIIVTVVGAIVILIVSAVVESAYFSGVLDIANGQPVTYGSFFKPRNVGNVIVATVIVGILAAIGYALCIIPGIIVAVFTMFTIVALLDRNLSGIDAIKASFDIARANFGTVLLAFLVIFAITLVGALLCGVGLLVAAPVAALYLVYTYRRLTHGQVAPLTP
jgi:uncharacterized membrane protein